MPRALNNNPLATAAVVFLLTAAIAAGLIHHSEQQNLQADRARVAALAKDHARAIELAIERALSSTYALAALVRQGNGAIRDFEATAQQMLPFYPGAASLQLAPGGIVQHIVPLAGNEKAIGHNLLQDPARNKEAFLARDTGKLTLAGPFNLMQGGLGAVGRLPVFLGDGEGVFWGFTTVLIRFPEALVGARLPQLAEQGLNYELWRVHPDSGQKQTIASSSSAAPVAPVDQILELAYGNWTLSVAPGKGWGDPAGLWLKAGFGLIFSLLLGYVAMLLIKLQAHQVELEQKIAERTQALAKVNDDLAGRESLLRQILDTSSVAIFLVDTNGRISQANKRMAEMFRCSLDELVGSEYVALVHPSEREIARQKMLALLVSSIAAVDLDRLYWRADHSQFWGHLTGKRFYDADGEERGLIGVIADIDERQQAMEQLRKVSLAVEQSEESIVITNVDARIEYVNDAFVRATGYSREEAIGQNPRILNSGKTPAATHVAMWRTLAQGRPWKGEFHNKRKDGSEFIEQATITPLRQPNGDITHYVATKEDITEKKRLADEMEQHRNNLEALVLQRTRELAQAKEAAESANLAKSAFLANMSHEIRTPMNGILGMANILRRGGVTPQQAGRLDTIDASAQHLLGIINNILDLSKIEAGMFLLEEAPIALDGLLDNVRSLLAERAAAKGLRLLIESEPLPPRLKGDPTRLQQALLNYAANAIKFTETGRVTLRTRTLEETAESVRVRFEVTDTGIGIPPEVMPRLFGAFEQADNSTTRKYGGTGLGLAITRRLAELMGGEAGAGSVPGVGSTFWFEARLKKSAAAVAPPASSPDAEAQIRQRFHGCRMLVADDEPVNLEVARMLLEDLGLVIDSAQDGAEAVTLAQETPYALVFMDMQMPNVDGLEATRQIRKLNGYRDTPIIAMTANAFAEDRTRCFEAGMSDFLTKPFSPDTLFDISLRWLDRRHGGA